MSVSDLESCACDAEFKLFFPFLDLRMNSKSMDKMLSLHSSSLQLPVPESISMRRFFFVCSSSPENCDDSMSCTRLLFFELLGCTVETFVGSGSSSSATREFASASLIFNPKPADNFISAF